jgi:hypothetical protein
MKLFSKKNFFKSYDFKNMSNVNNAMALIIGAGVGLFVVMLIDKLSGNNRGVSLDGKPLQIPLKVFDRPTGNEIGINVRFPKGANGILMFAKNSKEEFQILYVKDGAVILNTNNDSAGSLVLFGKSEKNYWRRFGITLLDSLKTSPVFIGGGASILPDNLLALPGTSVAEPFPANGLVGCVKVVVNGKSDLTEEFLKRELKECWGL